MHVTTYAHNIAHEYVLPAHVAVSAVDAVRAAWTDGARATDYRDAIMQELKACGWKGPVAIDEASGITITAEREGCGLCVQTGNMSRFYADLLKLQHLYRSGRICGGIYILPTDSLARRLSDNTAAFNRFVRELGIFQSVISIPLLVLAFE